MAQKRKLTDGQMMIDGFAVAGDTAEVSQETIIHPKKCGINGVSMGLRRKLLTAVLGFLFVCVAPTFSQTAAPGGAPAKDAALPSAEELSAKCAKGSGGKEAWAKISTLVLSGTIEIPAMGATGKVEVVAKAPNKILQSTSLADGQFVQKQGFDGRVGWKFDTQQGLKKLEGAELEEARTDANFDTDVRLKEIYPDLKVTGRTKVGSHDAYTAVAHVPGGKTLTFYLDAESGRRVAEDTEGPDESGKVEKTSLTFEEYKAVEGIQIPTKIGVTTSAFSFVISIQEVKHNVPVDDAIFAMPAGNPTGTTAH
jgi:hypothetical protein